MMSQQAPVNLIKISRYLKGRVRYQNNPILATSLGRLILLFSTSVFLTLWLTTGAVDATVLFQSPESPPVQPPVEQPPVEQAPAPQPAVEQPAAEQAPAAQPSVEQPPVEQAPAAQPAVEQPSAEQAPVEQPLAQPSPTQSAPSAGQTIVEPAPAEPTPSEPVSRRREETSADETEAGEPSNFILDQAEFIDTVIVSGAYVWLCCGVATLLLVPLALLFVYIRGRSKIMKEGH